MHDLQKHFAIFLCFHILFWKIFLGSFVLISLCFCSKKKGTYKGWRATLYFSQFLLLNLFSFFVSYLHVYSPGGYSSYSPGFFSFFSFFLFPCFLSSSLPLVMFIYCLSLLLFFFCWVFFFFEKSHWFDFSLFFEKKKHFLFSFVHPFL